jgi:hypothetical protein
MVTFLLMVIAVGCVTTVFGAGILIGLQVRKDDKAERIRQTFNQAVDQISGTVDYYTELQKYIWERVSGNHK